MNLSDISTQLLFTTVPIWVQNSRGETSSGTAFIYNWTVPGNPQQAIPFLITNHHVVAGGTKAIVQLLLKSGELPDTKNQVRVEIDGSLLTKHVDTTLDLAVIPFGPILNEFETRGTPLFFRSVSQEILPTASIVESLAAMEDIVFIGYPSGLRDQHNSTPLIRRGITATPAWNDFDGQPVFLIDAGVFPGSSGSPVFILNQGAYPTPEGLNVGNRLLFLGVVSETFQRGQPNDKAYLGLGKVIKGGAVSNFVERIAKLLGNQSVTQS